MTLLEQAQRARAASYELLTTDTRARDGALLAMADALEAGAEAILAANAQDLAAARAAGRREALLDRLALSPARIAGMANGLRKVAALPDPVGGADTVIRRPNGLSIEKRRVPIGVVGIIYEARPNVTADAAGLCLKSANACLLRGGSEALLTNCAVVDCLSAAAEAHLPAGAVQLVRDPSRETAAQMMRLNGYLDVLIPRGGAGLIRSVVETASVPVIETGAGVCHTYVDAAADIPMAAAIVANAKCSRPSVCNACETLLVHEEIAARAAGHRRRARGGARDRAARLPARLRHPAAGAARDGGGLVGRIRGLHPRRARRLRRGGGDRAHQPLRHAPQRMYRDRAHPDGRAVPQRRGRGGGLCQRLHALYRRGGVRLWRGDRHQHAEAARARADGAARAHEREIRRARRGPGPLKEARMDGIRLIALDIDLTLTSKKDVISARNMAAIRAAQEKGVFVTIATGRGFLSSRRIWRALAIDGPTIQYGGAMIVHSPSGEPLKIHALDAGLVSDALEAAHALGIHVQIFEGDTVVTERDCDFFRYYCARTDLPWRIEPELRRMRHEHIPKVLAYAEPELAPAYRDRIAEALAGRAAVTISQPGFIEINGVDVSKGAALAELAAMRGVARADVAAIGDSTLDLSMIEWAGWGVAVANSTPEVLAAADLVVPACEDDGVAAFIEEHVL